MNRTELVTAVSERSGPSRPAVEDVTGVLGQVVGAALVAGDRVALPGLLTAARVERAERQGRTPQTGQVLPIAAPAGVELSPAAAPTTQVEGR